MPSGKKSKQARRAAQLKTPPPVRSKGGRAGGGWVATNRWWALGGGAAVVAVIVIVVAVTAFGGGSAKPSTVDFAALPGLQTGPPPWNNGSGELQGALPVVHLNPLGQEGSALHIHQHLDAYVDGKHVTLPAGIGIFDNSFITEVHTHQPDGVIHVESPTNRPYTLGQLFGEWEVRLTRNCLGRYCGSLHWWVNGTPETGNPADLVLRAHQEIVIAAGKPPAHIPSTYAFPAGE